MDGYDATRDVQAAENEDAEAVRESVGRPRGAFKEVVVGVQVMAMSVIGGRIGIPILADALERLVSQTHDPAEQESLTTEERRGRKGGDQHIDEWTQEIYDGPHGGTSCFLWFDDYKIRRNPLFRLEKDLEIA